MTTDVSVLRAVFASRVQLAKLPMHEAIQQAQAEWHRTQLWWRSNSTKEGSFVWFCDSFDLDVSAVRRAIRENKK